MATKAPALPVIEPVDLRTRSQTRRLRRTAEVAWTLNRHLAPVPVRWAAGRGKQPVRDLLGRPLQRSVFDLGVTFIKLGQLMASSPSLSGEVLSNAMRSVLDKAPPTPFGDVRRIVERDLGRPLETVYATFERKPFAAASLAVVHRAKLLDGTPVAVKVLRPQSEDSVRTDMAIVRPLVHWLAHQLPVGGIPALPEAIDGLAEQLAEELDLRNEARAMRWFAAVVDVIGLEGIRVPTPYEQWSSRNVLTMEFIEGFPIDDLEAIARSDVDARRSIESLIEAWFSVALCTGTFHGDMHAGNLMLTAAGEVVLLDWGIVGRLPAPSRRFFRRSLEGALGDESAWVDVRDHMLSTFGTDLLEQTGITPDQFMELVKAQTMLIMNMPFDQINLLMLMPAAQMDVLGDAAIEMPSGVRDWIRTIRDARRQARTGNAPQQLPPSRGELLLIKQLVFFERYGKMFLGDKPLIFDPDAYRRLLALPELDAG